MNGLKIQQHQLVSMQYLLCKEEFMEIVDKHLPVKKMIVRKNDASYMNAAWNAAIRKKRHSLPITIWAE